MTDNKTISKGQQISWVASLRGLLVFFVFFSHQTALPIDKDVLFVFGKVGVAGFFAMSGLLAKSALERRNLPQYAFNRFIRLYPVYWLLLLMVLLLAPDGVYGFKQILANITLFQQYIGFDNIIGASWMLSIMVVLYIVLAFCKRNPGKLVPIAFYALCFCAVLCGAGRYLIAKPLPTAIFLMSAVGCMGYVFKNEGERYGAIKIHLLVFEFTLAIASYLSYGMSFLLYLLAYNSAFALFYLFRRYEVNSRAMIFLGATGFTFFLAPDIPLKVIALFASDIKTIEPSLYVLLKFLTAIPFAWAVTKFIETPLLKWGKKIESRIS